MCNHLNRVAGRPVINMISIYHPEQKILVIDENSQTIDDGCWWAPSADVNSIYFNGLNVLSNRHYEKDENALDLTHGMGNAGFCDGHCERVTRVQSTSPPYYDPNVD